MFCATATTIERCKTEGVVDVFQVVKALRVQKPGAVRTVVSSNTLLLRLMSSLRWILYLQMQFKIIFSTVLMFLDSFDTYANF